MSQTLRGGRAPVDPLKAHIAPHLPGEPRQQQGFWTQGPTPGVVTDCNNPTTGGLSALHQRVCDRIAWPWARSWLSLHSRLELDTQSGWPLLRLVLLELPDAHGFGGVVGAELLLLRHYRQAAKQPLADLALSLEARVAWEVER